MTIGALLGKLSAWGFFSCIFILAFFECLEGGHYVRKSVIYGIILGGVATYIVTGGMLSFFEWIKPFLDMKITGG